MKSNRIIIILLVVLAVVIAIVAVAVQKGWIGKGDVLQVAAEKAVKRNIVETVTASGKINPHTEVKLSSEVSGEIITLNAHEGDSVKKGQLLCVINPEVYDAMVTQGEASVNQMKANLASSKANLIQMKAAQEQAKRNYDRSKKLHDDKVVSDADYEASKLSDDQADANYQSAQEQVNANEFSVKSAEAQLSQARDNRNKTSIFAPMSGIVSLVNVKLGERVVGTAQMAGTELIRVADLNYMQAEVDVNENDVLRITLGDTADIEVDAYVKKKFKGVVTEISYSSTSAAAAVISTSQATNFTVKIKVLSDSYADLINRKIGKLYPFRPGMSTTVDIKTESRSNVLTVPIQSVTTRQEKDLKQKDADFAKTAQAQKSADVGKKDAHEVVFVVENGVVKAKDVTTGIQDANYIEIKTGLDENETIVKAPFKLISKTLKAGDAVQVVDEKDLFKDQSADK
jgi:HlyD family secretion protein